MPWRKRKTGTAKQRGKAFKTSDKGGYPKHVIKLERKIPEEWKNMSFTLPTFECKRCNHKWIPRKPETPTVCPKCKSPYWNREKTPS